MLQTDHGTKFEIMMEATLRQRTEQDINALKNAPIVFAYSEALVNIVLDDGRVMKGQRVVIMHEEIK